MSSGKLVVVFAVHSLAFG